LQRLNDQFPYRRRKIMTQEMNIQPEEAHLPLQELALEFTASVSKLDPALIQLSKWANRHEASFATSEFARFKEEIFAVGGNIQPIKVRPLKNHSEGGFKFELIYGHRRHRACLELGLPVFALIEEVTDVELFEQMERENRGRKNLSPWEQGVMYRKARETKLYPSMRQLAKSLDVDISIVSKSLQLASLPASVIAAFPSPLSIQFRWATPLTEAGKSDAKGLRERAHAMVQEAKGLSASAVFARLMDEPEGLESTQEQALQDTLPDTPQSVQDVTALNRSTATFTIMKANKPAATLSTDAQGRAVMQFEAGVLGQERQAALMRVMEEFLSYE
jgi:ParB family transcriptional regulator, chromosome partitioning protein